MTEAQLDQYKVRPRKRCGGWNLESDRLSHGLLWYQSEADAIGYAKWNSRVRGCKIDVLNDADEIISTDEFPPAAFAY